MAYVTLSEYSKRIGKDPRNVLQKINRGNLPAVKSEGTWLVDENEPYIDGRRKGHNDVLLAKREAKKRHGRYVFFLRQDGKIHTEVGIGMRKELVESLDLTGKKLYHTLNFEDVQRVAKGTNEDRLRWIDEVKDKNTRVKRRKLVEYLSIDGNYDTIVRQFAECESRQ